MNETVLLKISKIVGVFREGNSIRVREFRVFLLLFLLSDIIPYATNWKRSEHNFEIQETRLILVTNADLPNELNNEQEDG